MDLSRKRDYNFNYEWILSPLPQLSTILALASLLLQLLESLPFSSSPKLILSNPSSCSFSLYLPQKFVKCVNDLISLKTRVYIGST